MRPFLLEGARRRSASASWAVARHFVTLRHRVAPSRSNPTSEDPDDTLIGTPFGSYELCFELGSGGMATVFLARCRGAGGLERLVALKRIHPHLARQSDFVDMFLDEANLTTLLNHPYLCRVYDFGEVDDTYFLSMEYLRGEPLSRVMARLRSGSPEQAGKTLDRTLARILADLCEGLHAAHQTRDHQGLPLKMIHRDISPQNLFVCDDGTVRVLDFGVAHATGRRTETQTDQMKGKLAYLAPEQIRRRPIDHRVDVWAMGVVAWEAFTLKRLFKRDSEIDTMMAVAGEDIPRPSAIRPRLPKALDAIVMKALERDPSDRYASARELSRALRAFSLKGAEVIDEGHVESWMERLFGEERLRRARLMKLAAQPRPGPVPGKRDTSDSAETHEPQEVPPETSVPTPVASAPRQRSGVVVVALAVVLVASAAGGLAWSLSRRTVIAAGSDTPERTAAPDADESLPRAEVASLQDAADPDAATPDAAAPSIREAALEADRLPDTVAPGTGGPDVAPSLAAERPRGRGTLVVVTVGEWSEVYIGSRRVGESMVPISLPVGTHRVELRPNGDKNRSVVRRVTVRRGETSRLSEHFE